MIPRGGMLGLTCNKRDNVQDTTEKALGQYFGRLGGLARAAKLSPERPQEIGRMGAEAARRNRELRAATADLGRSLGRSEDAGPVESPADRTDYAVPREQ